MTKEEAAQALNVHPRTILRYIKKGKLRTIRRKHRVGVRKEDVDLAKQEEDQTKSLVPFTAETLNRHQQEIRLLRSEVDLLHKVLTAKHQKLELTKAELLDFYRRCEFYSERDNRWPDLLEEEMLETFAALRYTDLERLEELVPEDPHPWRPIYRLVMAMELRPADLRLKHRFGAARMNIEYISYLWVEIHGGTVKTLDLMVEREALPYRRVIRRLGKNPRPEG